MRSFCCSISQRMLRHLTNWLRRVDLPISWENVKHPVEFLAMGFIYVASLAVYMYGVIWTIPSVVNEETVGTQVQWLAFIAASWCLFGIWANLFLLRYRESSIRHRFLTQPHIVAENENTRLSSSSSGDTDPENSVRDRSQMEMIRNLGQQFMVSPFGSETAWHICATCEVYVPPRAWHCSTCNICVLRRDHHCIFAMACIGEDNQSNFLGLLAYLSIGSTYATSLAMAYTYYQFELSPLYFVLKCFFSWYVIIFDFSVLNMLSSIAFLGGGVSWAVFGYYLWLALKNQTSADQSRGIKRSVSGTRNYSYANLKAFLGPNPILRILWPLSPVIKTDYGAAKRSSQTDSSKTV